jgi:hypothetical protein
MKSKNTRKHAKTTTRIAIALLAVAAVLAFPGSATALGDSSVADQDGSHGSCHRSNHRLHGFGHGHRRHGLGHRDGHGLGYSSGFESYGLGADVGGYGYGRGYGFGGYGYGLGHRGHH